MARGGPRSRFLLAAGHIVSPHHTECSSERAPFFVASVRRVGHVMPDEPCGRSRGSAQLIHQNVPCSSNTSCENRRQTDQRRSEVAARERETARYLLRRAPSSSEKAPSPARSPTSACGGCEHETPISHATRHSAQGTRLLPRLRRHAPPPCAWHSSARLGSRGIRWSSAASPSGTRATPAGPMGTAVR